MSREIFQVDAFTDRPFHGNPAAVCLLERPRADSWMCAVAAEMNASETAFLLRGPQGFDLRWFSPTTEVDLCGHATLASAHILWQTGTLRPADTARFHTRSGVLTARRADDGWIELDFPSDSVAPVEDADAVEKALGVEARFVGRGKFDYLVGLESEGAVRSVLPDFAAIEALSARGVIVTAPCGSPDYDFVSRFFCPALGVNEDPVTGSAHCALAPFWAGRLNKTEMTGLQVSARGGTVGVRMEQDRVILRGQAVTVLRALLSPEASQKIA